LARTRSGHCRTTKGTPAMRQGFPTQRGIVPGDG
jgi:hypothetical protein